MSWPIIKFNKGSLELLYTWVMGFSPAGHTVLWVWVNYDPSRLFSCYKHLPAANKPFWTAAHMASYTHLFSKTYSHEIGAERYDVTEEGISKTHSRRFDQLGQFFANQENWRLSFKLAAIPALMAYDLILLIAKI